MAISQNGWTVYHSAPSGRSNWITGRTAPGDVNTILNYLADRFDSDVENVRQDWSWGWAPRPVRGQTSGFSNHASGTAIDLNAPAHPLGSAGTFSSQERAAIRKILDDLDGTIRWGGDYSGRKDEMHFEIDATEKQVAAVARKIRNGEIGQPARPPKPKKSRGPRIDRALRELDKARRLAAKKGWRFRRRQLHRATRAIRRIAKS